MANITIGISAQDNASEKLQKVGSSAEKMSSEVKSAAEKTSSAASGVGKVGTEAESSASKMSSASERISSASKESAGYLRQVGSSAREMASQTASSASKAGSSATSLGDRFRALGDRIAAVAGGMGLYTLGSKVVDFAKESISAMGELGESTEQLQGVMGGTAEQVSSFLSVGTRFSLSTNNMAVSGRTLAKALTEASNGSSTYTSVFKQLGISVKDSNGNLKSATQVLPEVADSFSKMTSSSQKAYVAQKLFGRSGSKLIPLLNQGSAGLEKYEKAAQKAGSTIGEDGVESAYKYRMAQADLNESVQGLQISIGKNLYPILTRIVNVISTKVIPAVSSALGWIKRNQSSIVAWAKVIAAAAAPIAVLVAGLKILQSVMNMAKLVQSMTNAFKLFTTGANTAKVAQTGLNTAMKANVFILIATVIAQLIVALVTWLTTTKQGRKAWADFCDAMQRTGQAMADWFKKAFNDLKSFFKTTWDDITGFFRSAGTNISNIWNNVVDFFKAIPGRIKDFFSDAGSWLLNAGRNVVDGLINGIESKFAAIGNVVSSMASKITGGFKSLLGINSPSKVFSGFGQNVGEGFINGVTSKISNAQAAVKRLVTLPTTQSMGLSGLQLAGVTSAASKAGTSGNVIIGTLNAGNKTTNEIMSGLNGLARGRGQS